MRIWVQTSASMQKRTSPLKFGDLAEKSGLNSVSNLSTKVPSPATHTSPGTRQQKADLEAREYRAGGAARRARGSRAGLCCGLRCDELCS